MSDVSKRQLLRKSSVVFSKLLLQLSNIARRAPWRRRTLAQPELRLKRIARRDVEFREGGQVAGMARRTRFWAPSAICDSFFDPLPKPSRGKTVTRAVVSAESSRFTMDIDDRTRIALPLIVRMALIGALAGAVYGYFATMAVGGAGIYGIERGLLSGAIIGGVLTSLNIFALQAPIGGGVRRAPFLLHVALKSLIYLVVFFLAIAVGQWLVPIPSFAGFQIGLGDILYFITISFVISFLLDLNSLLGQNVLLSFVTGRYFRPRVEERIFLIIDMKSSTAAAERLGEVDFHRLLNRFISDLTGSIVVQRGQIHKYVGDELIATWPLAAGLKNARCLRACFGAIERLASLGPSYEREFRLRVDFRAGLHCGPVVIGEMGTIKREIALIGDTMNTAARIVDFARDSGEPVIASAALINQLAMPAGIAACALGPIRLRGKKSPMELLALKADAATLVRSPAA
jgi:adenylate cyclase